MVGVSTFLAPYVREADFAVRPPWVIGPRTIHDYLLIYVQSGEFVAHFSGQEVVFAPGELCLIPPALRHTIEGRTDTITPYAHIDLYYDPANDHRFPVSDRDLEDGSAKIRMQPRLSDLFAIEVPVNLKPHDPVRFRDLLIRTVGTWQNDDVLSRLEANQMATELLLMILRTYRKDPVQMNGTSPESFGWITSYLSFHLSDSLSVEDMATRANLSVSRFSATFRTYFGCPPFRYLRRLRVSHAQDLLTETTLTLDVIAVRCGFANAQHFSRTFRQDVGCTPGQFRLRTQRHPLEFPASRTA